MSNPSALDQDRATGPESPTNNETNESFGDILTQYEQSHTHRITEPGKKGLEGTVVAITSEAALLDIGFKTEGIIPSQTSEHRRYGEGWRQTPRLHQGPRP